MDFSARTVISPDPNIGIDELIMPITMAKELTFPEAVNAQNMHKMKKMLLNGPDSYPGANYLLKENGQRFILAYGNRRYSKYTRQLMEDLKVGDVLLRHLLQNDVVLFNRQPSLHRMSMMAHRIRVMEWNTLRFNECVCTPYNADFDGDEMNIHVPQTWESKAEALVLMKVQENLITPKNGEPIIALTQDFLTTSFLITNKDNFYNRQNFCLICSYF